MFLFSGWAGGLVDRYGSKLPLTLGPLIAGCGFLLFALPPAQAGSYWTSFFPAVLLLSVGMTITVAPLTTTVLGAVEVSHAGIASGINNVVSRAASLLAIAAFGVIMLNTFGSSLSARAQQLPLTDQQREQLVMQRGALADVQMPRDLDMNVRRSAEQAVADSFVSGFRRVAVITALLAWASAIAAWLLIEGRPQRAPAASTSTVNP